MPWSRQKSSAVARVRVWAQTKRRSPLLPCTDATSERPQRPSPTIAARIIWASFALRGIGADSIGRCGIARLSRVMTVRLTSGPTPLNALPDKIMHTNAAIIGVGQSAYTRRPQPGQSTHTFIRDAVVAALEDAEVDARGIDGMAVASFSLAPHAGVDLARKLGLSLRWLLHDTNGGSSAMNMLGHALRGVETGAASVILVAGGGATGLGGYAKVAANFHVVEQFHLTPLGHGGPNGVYALV